MHTSRRRPRFAGGAVVASLAVEVFPQAFAEEKYTTGVAAALGVVLALALGLLG
jgi:ZIP family zinc transporter